MKDLCSFHSGSRDHVTQLKTGCGLLVFMTSFFNIDHYLSLDLVAVVPETCDKRLSETAALLLLVCCEQKA